jgi:hypothetical protein
MSIRFLAAAILAGGSERQLCARSGLSSCAASV